MAFFVGNDRSYFSLSLDPAGPNETYVFQLSDSQARAARVILPACLALASGAACLTLLLAIADYAGISAGLRPAQQTLAICSLAVVASLSAFAEILWFLWVHDRRKAALSERQRRSLGALRLLRRPSLEAYWSFLLAMFVPVLGMIIMQRMDPASAGDALSNPVILLPLAVGSAALTLGLLKQIVAIGGAHDAR